ncbi:MAG: phosphoribosylamine--glycine ligase [Deltaproteobacteria bacterium]|nr:phosphoribosylamine--glycine ligase [Deltaproteobacteria bacterium]
MNILVIGSGGREHALAWKIRQSPLCTNLYIAPGNGGTAQEGQNIPVKDDDIPAILQLAKDKAIDLVVVGPELPLVLGLKNALDRERIPCFGPGAYCAQLEGSKAFAKSLMRETGVPTADFAVFDDYDLACSCIRQHPLPMVVKADGLAAGKGVVVCQTREEAQTAVKSMMIDRVFGAAGDRVVIEEALQGEEASFLVFCDGSHVAPLPSSQDHKRVGDGDTGPNTGGMGAYSPAPILPEALFGEICDLVIRPIVRRLASKGHFFRGVLYAGLMMTEEGPKVLEYNVRFGDPECQPLLMRLKTDIVEIMRACLDGRLDSVPVEIDPRSAMCVVMAAKGYPGDYPKGMAISGIAQAEMNTAVKVFQAGTRLEGETILTSGGRVLGVTALGEGLSEARDLAYDAVRAIRFENSYCRNDIGAKGLRT